jgi:hypothetical protein
MESSRASAPSRAATRLLELGLLLITPLIFYRGFSEQFTYVKLVLTEVLVLIGAAGLVLGLVWGRLRWPKDSRLSTPLALLVLAVLFSCWNSPVRALSFVEGEYFLCGPVWLLLLMTWGDGGPGVRRIAGLVALAGAIVAGIKRKHNVFEQLGINPQEAFGYQIIEPLIQLRKDGVRKVAQALGLPASIYDRMPFPGPGLAARVIGEATAERLELVRQATAIMEAALSSTGAFQCMAILHEDRVTGMREGRRQFGCQVEIRCWESIDARTARPMRLPWDSLEALSRRILDELPGVVSVTYNIAPKPPSTMEAV